MNFLNTSQLKNIGNFLTKLNIFCLQDVIKDENQIAKHMTSQLEVNVAVASFFY